MMEACVFAPSARPPTRLWTRSSHLLSQAMARETSVAPDQRSRPPTRGRAASDAPPRAVGRERKTAPWTALLDEGARRRAARARGARGTGHGATRGRTRQSCTRSAGGAAAERDRAAVLPSGAGPALRLGGPDDRHDRDGLGQVAVLQPADARHALPRRQARALYLYPTKALAQDQARALNAFGLTKRVRPAIYDGDTPREARADIRRNANVVLTNPDMLHVGILPNHAAWAELFANLAVVVIDEAHVYRGVFGSHVAGVLRRLRRIAAAYGTAAAVPAHLGDDRQPGRAGRAPDGAGGGRADRRRRLARAVATDRDVEPAVDRRGAGRAPLRAGGGGRAAGATRRARARGRSAS